MADLAYLAGLFDGEGTFSIQVDQRKYKGRGSVHFNPRMSMSLKHGVEVLRELQEEFGGNIYHYGEDGSRWSMGTREGLISAAERLLPHLKIKAQIAQRFLEALRVFPESRKAHRNGTRSWTREMTMKVARIAITLNVYKKSPKTEAFLKKLDQMYQT